MKIVAGEDLEQNDDMSRQEFLDKMTPEEKKQLEELKKTNSQALQANVVIKQLNADLAVVSQDQKEIDNAPATVAQTLGANASRTDTVAKASEIKTAKYNDIVKPDYQGYRPQTRRGPAVEQAGLWPGRAGQGRRRHRNV